MEQQPKVESGTQTQLLIKMAFILVLILILIIPVVWIQSLIQERTYLQQQVEQEVAASWGNQQTLQGPVLCIPYLTTTVVDKKSYTEQHLMFVSPMDQSIKSDAVSEIRTKGIFNTVVFTTTNEVTGSFDLSKLPQEKNQSYEFDKAILITGITDPTAITSKIDVLWDNAAQESAPGIKHQGFAHAGFHCPAPIKNDQKTYAFNLKFSVRGTSALAFIPSGKVSDITLKSNWPSPSFTGKNLPQTRNITDQGFDAKWTANVYNRPFGDFWRDAEYSPQPEQTAFGVTLLQTADYYQKNMRSAKYAMLVIALSFMFFFFYEMLLKIRIHPIQYLLVGLSLAVFYALLLSITEHLGFNKAYWISCAAVVLLIAVYAYAIIKKLSLIALLVFLFVLLYAYIFVLLQLEDFALLAGSIGLFFILATVMLLSRKIDWYRINV